MEWSIEGRRLQEIGKSRAPPAEANGSLLSAMDSWCVLKLSIMNDLRVSEAVNADHGGLEGYVKERERERERESWVGAHSAR